MKINNLKINQYGKLKNKEINLENKINIIYGKNEAGKSTLLNFISNIFYGISKNKRGKDFSNFEKYKPWVGEEFSGKIEYELDNKEIFEVYRDFNKKNPKIYNENKEDISKQFNIDKSKGNEFFYEQTKIDEELFLSTVLIGQQEIKLGKTEQNILIQKIANLVGTGDDNVSFKRSIERLNRRQLNEVGTDRSREKPINIIEKNIEKLENEKNNLKKYESLKYELNENKNKINNEIINLENENKFLTEIKLLNENEKIEKEKINLKNNLKNENNEKINLLKNKINEIEVNNKKNKLEKNKNNNLKLNKMKKKYFVIILILIIINLIQTFFVNQIIIKIGLWLTVPIALLFYYFDIKKQKNEKSFENEDDEKNNLEINNLNNEIKILENNNQKLQNEINNYENNFNLKFNLEKEKIKNKYLNKIEKNKINNYLNNYEKINLEKENNLNLLNNKKIELHYLELDEKNIEPQLDNFSKIEEELIINKNKKENLIKLDKSINLAREVLINNYEKMKNLVTPKFTQNLSNSISEITYGKYQNVRYQDEIGLMVELENGDYVPAEKLSIGTIDQLYLSLRLSMVEELSEEKMPIIMDEAFAFYDEVRLENILKYINERFSEHQIIIFTCTNREKEILDKLNISYNLIEL